MRKNRYITAFVVLSAAHVAAQGRVAKPEPASSSKSATVVFGRDGQLLDRTVQRATGGGFWGCVLVARGSDVLLAKGYGNADYAGVPNTPHALFEIASASKQFTAAGILKLEMEGRLKLEDSIAKLLGDVVPKDKSGITVHHLLTHTSGISPKLGLPYASRASRDELIRMVMGKPLDSVPGAKFADCNVGYALLAAIIEIASKQSFEGYMKAKIFKPAGLRDTGFVQDRELDGTQLTVRLSERTIGSTATKWSWSWGYRGMGGVVTTVYDLLQWHRALAGDVVLDKRAKARFKEPFRDGYALGWRVATSEKGTLKLAHGGSVLGYGCRYVRYPDDDVVIAILSNGKTNVLTVQRAIESVLFPAPKVSLKIDVTPFELHPRSRSVRVEAGASLRVAAQGDGVVMTVQHPKKGHPMATVRMPKSYARKLSLDLLRMLPAKEDSATAPEIEAGIYLLNYRAAGRQLSLEGVKPVLMPRYVGVGEDGKRVVDERITFVVKDASRRFWPVMVKLNRSASRVLHEQLRDATH